MPRNRWNEYMVAFDGDRVSHVGPYRTGVDFQK